MSFECHVFCWSKYWWRFKRSAVFDFRKDSLLNIIFEPKVQGYCKTGRNFKTKLTKFCSYPNFFSQGMSWTKIRMLKDVLVCFQNTDVTFAQTLISFSSRQYILIIMRTYLCLFDSTWCHQLVGTYRTSPGSKIASRAWTLWNFGNRW